MQARAVAEQFHGGFKTSFQKLKNSLTFHEALTYSASLTIAYGFKSRFHMPFRSYTSQVGSKHQFKVFSREECAILNQENLAELYPAHQVIHDVLRPFRQQALSLATLAEFSCRGKVLRGLKYVEQNWVWNVSCIHGIFEGYYLYTARVTPF